MSTKANPERATLLQGTLDLLILRTLATGPHHGHGIALGIQHSSQGALLAEWGVSDNNRRARFYQLTATGRRRLVAEASEWRRLAAVVALVLGPELSGG
jgi:PadR family transcriptional regulator PadR